MTLQFATAITSDSKVISFYDLKPVIAYKISRYTRAKGLLSVLYTASQEKAAEYLEKGYSVTLAKVLQLPDGRLLAGFANQVLKQI